MADIFKYNGIEFFPNASFPLAISPTTHAESVQLHTHDFVEIVLVISGSCLHSVANPSNGNINGSDFRISAGDLFVIAPGETHTYLNTDQLEILNIIFFPNILQDDLTNLRELPGIFEFLVMEPLFRYETDFCHKLNIPRAERGIIIKLLREIESELKKQQNGYTLVARSNFLKFLVYAARLYNSANRSAKELKDLHSKREAVTQAIEFIHTNSSSPLSLDHIADEVYLSPHYFSSLFKSFTGQSPWDYLTRVRIENAKKKLTGSKESITEIAISTGFNSSNYFARIFKSYTGYTPGEYRKTTGDKN